MSTFFFKEEVNRIVSDGNADGSKREEKGGGISRKEVLQKIYDRFSRFLEERFGKSLNYYKVKIVEMRGSIFYVISQVEKVSEVEIYEDFKKVVEDVFKECRIERFVYFRDEISENRIDEWKKRDYKVIENVFIPFSLFRKDIEDEVLENVIILIDREKGKKDRRGEEGGIEGGEGEEEESLGQKVFRDIIFSAVKKDVSDIHVVPSGDAYYVYFRIDGFFVLQRDLVLTERKGDAFLTYLLRRASREVRGQFNPDTRMVYQDARISVPEVQDEFGISLDIRIAFVPDGVTLTRMDVCIRMLYKRKRENGKELGEVLSELGYLDKDARVLESIIYRKNGIVVISGITNSGKSTLVSTLLSCIGDKKIGTIEDPIEYFVDNPNYVQHQLFISEKEKLTMDFEDYVKAFKRSDYDIVFVGEWRKHKGLTEAMLEQAYAGQLIFTTLHIGNSFQIFDATRTIFGVNPDELKPVLLLSWNQVLVPKLCDGCKKRVKRKRVGERALSIVRNSSFLTGEMLKKVETFFIEECFVKGEGCEKCGGLGYRGRQVVYDYFVPSYDLWEKIGNDYSPFSILKNAAKKKTKIDVFLELVKKGVLSPDDIYMVL